MAPKAVLNAAEAAACELPGRRLAERRNGSQIGTDMQKAVGEREARTTQRPCGNVPRQQLLLLPRVGGYGFRV